MRSIPRLVSALTVFLVAGGMVSPAARAAVLVEAVREGGTAADAGIQVGDVLLTWSRLANPPLHPQPAEGSLQTPLDYPYVTAEQAPRGPVTLWGSRDGEQLSWTLPQSGAGWGLSRLAPQLDAPHARRWHDAKHDLADRDVTSAVARVRELAREFVARGERQTAAWMPTRQSARRLLGLRRPPPSRSSDVR